MADRYERWNKWAPRYIADLMHDFGLKDWQAAAFPGNAAAESGYFNSLQELNPLVPGSRGGLGHFQWTGPRRRQFEAWLKRKGWVADSYEGNYSMLFRDLNGPEAAAVEQVKLATSPENAAWRVAKYFERPAVINTGPRAKATLEALALYRANPVPPTVWETDLKEPAMPVPSAPEPGNVVVMPADPAKPVAKSIVMQGAIGGLVAALYAIVQEYNPALTFKQQPATFWYAIAGFLTAAWTIYGRLSSNAQPITLTQAGADKIAAERTIAEVPQGPGPAPTTGSGVRYNEPPAPVLAPPPTPLEALPLNHLVNELPRVLDLIGVLLPQVAVIGRIAAEVGKIQAAAAAPSRPPGT